VGALAAFDAASQAAAYLTGAPTAAAVTAALAGSPAISGAFGAAPTYFAIGEVGVGSTATGTDSGDTETSTLEVKVDLTELALRQDLLIGFYHGTTTGAGVTGVNLDVFVDGNALIHQSFATGAAAETWFTNHALDLGSLASGAALGANTLDVKVELSIPAESASAGFYGDVVIGDPLATATAATAHWIV
jgi:hypothetical protein